MQSRVNRSEDSRVQRQKKNAGRERNEERKTRKKYREKTMIERVSESKKKNKKKWWCDLKV